MTKSFIYWLLAILWMFVIFMFSNQDSQTSNEGSTQVIEYTVEEINDVTNAEIDKTSVSDTLNVPLRKISHVMEYFILVLLIINALASSKKKFVTKNLYILSFAICYLYSCTDEFHQSLSNRDGRFIDTLIDSIGIVIGLVVYNFYKQNSLKTNKKSKKNIYKLRFF